MASCRSSGKHMVCVDQTECVSQRLQVKSMYVICNTRCTTSVHGGLLWAVFIYRQNDGNERRQGKIFLGHWKHAHMHDSSFLLCTYLLASLVGSLNSSTPFSSPGIFGWEEFLRPLGTSDCALFERKNKTVREFFSPHCLQMKNSITFMHMDYLRRKQKTDSDCSAFTILFAHTHVCVRVCVYAQARANTLRLVFQ